MAPAVDIRRVPYDPELQVALAPMQIPGGATREMIPLIRQQVDQAYTAASVLSAYPNISHEERTISGPHGDIQLSIFRPAKRLPEGNPGIYWIHGGGMIAGNRFMGMGMHGVADWMVRYDAVAVAVEYRRAPENPDPMPVDDCYAGLQWVAEKENLQSLGINAEKLVIAGQSAGAGLAAGTALLARDRGGPSLCGQLLLCPMLDDRNASVSARQYKDEGSWSGTTNAMAWKCLLGNSAGGTETSIYAAPARAADLSGLPPAFIDVTSAEAFRDEDVAYASKLWEGGVQAELHVWPGGFHGFDMFVPSHALAQLAIASRTAWLGRVLSAA
ncbi:Carboxylesterase NlhH [Lachnellula cervina]|uniref:Carboxylesterase NlhH n=1 Tax=Lachnellula cervina TaxID=1316786 RepID=A0A7D8UR65_9HELO|nr:Carboxylesterase NlhH [Lachnellula cervina]